jgi:hypothetical protein
MKLDIVVPCGPKAEFYVPFVINKLVSLSSEHDPRFILMEHRTDLSSLKDHPNVKKIVRMPDDIPDSHHSASESHARSVNESIQFIDTEISMIMDYDIVFMSKGWDKWMVDNFKDPEVGIVGTEYKDEMRGAPKYLDYPTIIMCMLRTDLIHKHKLNFRPKYDQIIIKTKELSNALGRKIGDRVQPDSGYEIAYKLRPAGVKCVTLKYIHQNGALPVGQNFENTGVYANHMKSGSIQKKEVIEYWRSEVDKFITSHNRF